MELNACKHTCSVAYFVAHSQIDISLSILDIHAICIECIPPSKLESLFFQLKEFFVLPQRMMSWELIV
jgi:hypothetical protein